MIGLEMLMRGPRDRNVANLHANKPQNTFQNNFQQSMDMAAKSLNTKSNDTNNNVRANNMSTHKPKTLSNTYEMVGEESNLEKKSSEDIHVLSDKSEHELDMYGIASGMICLMLDNKFPEEFLVEFMGSQLSELEISLLNEAVKSGYFAQVCEQLDVDKGEAANISEDLSKILDEMVNQQLIRGEGQSKAATDLETSLNSEVKLTSKNLMMEKAEDLKILDDLQVDYVKESNISQLSDKEEGVELQDDMIYVQDNSLLDENLTPKDQRDGKLDYQNITNSSYISTHSSGIENRYDSYNTTSNTNNNITHNYVEYKEVLSYITDNVKFNISDFSPEATLQLRPENLGKLTVKIEVEKGIVQAKFIVENIQVKQIIESNFQELKDNLAKQGLNVQSLSVGIGNRDQGSSKSHYKSPNRTIAKSKSYVISASDVISAHDSPKSIYNAHGNSVDFLA